MDDFYEDWSFEKLKTEYMKAQKEIEELREVRELSRNFMQIVCNYDIRTPLMSIVGFTDILLQGIHGQIDEQARQDLTFIYDQGRDLVDIINTVMDTIKAERVLAGSDKPFPPEETDLTQVIPALDICRNERVEVTGLDGDLPTVSIDPFELELSITRTALVLSENFTKGKIVIKVMGRNEFVNIHIGNSEVVLPDKTLERLEEIRNAPTLFASEYISDELNLSIAQLKIEMYNGSMTLETNEDVGTEVLITLPIHK